MQLTYGTEKRKESAANKKKSEKHVPQVVSSAKFIMAEKKEKDKAAGKSEKGGAKGGAPGAPAAPAAPAQAKAAAPKK